MRKLFLQLAAAGAVLAAAMPAQADSVFNFDRASGVERTGRATTTSARTRLDQDEARPRRAQRRARTEQVAVRETPARRSRSTRSASAANYAEDVSFDAAPARSTRTRGRTRVASLGDNWGGGSAQSGIASFYWQPQRVASGGWFNPNAMTAAHRTLPFGTRVRVTHAGNGRSVVVSINDRGPYIGGRIIDLSKAAAGVIGMQGQGIAQVRVEVLGR